MNARVDAQVTEAQRIEAALDALVTAAVQHDRDKPTIPDREPISAGELVREVIDRMATWTKAQQDTDTLLRRPVASACRTAIRTLGKRLHEIGGDTLMLEVCDRVSAADPRNEGYRAGIIDHRWDGIGNWVA